MTYILSKIINSDDSVSVYVDGQEGITLFGKLIKPDLSLTAIEGSEVKMLFELKKVTQRGKSKKNAYCFAPDG